MIKRSIILWLCALLFFLSFPSIGETNAGIELTWDPFYDYIWFEKDYNKIYEDLVNQFSEALHMMKSPEERSKLSELIGKRLDNILNWGNKLAKSSKDDFTFSIKTPTQAFKNSPSDITTGLKNVLPKSITDNLNRVELRVWFSIAASAVETGLMIHGLFTTCDTIKKSEQFRESSMLQKETTKILAHLAKAEEFYRTADNEINPIEITSDIFIKENMLEKIDLNLGRAKLECERAQQVLGKILNDIHQQMEKLLSAKQSHANGFRVSLLRLIYTFIEYLLKPASHLTNLAKLFFTTNVCMQTANTAGHSIGWYWTNDEIHKLKEHKGKLNELEMKMKNSFDEINYGMERLKKIYQYIRT